MVMFMFTLWTDVCEFSFIVLPNGDRKEYVIVVWSCPLCARAQW